MLYKINPVSGKNDFLEEVEEKSGNQLSECLQCYKCGGMCKKSYKFDYTPRQVIEQIIDGQKEKVLRSRAIWICETCDGCQIDCPSAINMSRIMKVLRTMAKEEGIEPDISEIDRKFVKKAHCPKQDSQ